MNEIFKGMDNAAEKINENFQNGSIVDSGSNENGKWTKYGDGTMIQVVRLKKQQVNFNPTASFGPFYMSTETIKVDYPIPFTDNSNVSFLSFERGDMGYMLELPMYGESTTQSSGIRLLSNVSNSGTIYLKCLAIGSWK